MSDSPAVILYDSQGNPIGIQQDGLVYRLQVEAKGTVTANQGLPGVNPWLVDIQGGNVSVATLQQLSVETKLDVTGYDLQSSPYSSNVTFTSDSLLSVLELRFSTVSSRTITVSLDDGTVLFSETNSSLLLEIDFEDYAIDSGTVLSLTITQTISACLADITLTSKVGSPALGNNPTLGAGQAHIGSITIDADGNNASGDAFGRLRTSDPHSILEISHEYDLCPRLMGLNRKDAGTDISHSFSSALITVPAISGRKIVYQSHQYATYLPGKSQLIRITGLLDSGTSISGMGYGDGYDGIFLENNSATLQIKLLSSTIGNQTITQDQWNIDTLDGYGSSGILLNKNTAHHFVIDLQWLAVGRVRVGFDINGHITYVHCFSFSNYTELPYMRTATLPVCWYLESTGSAGSMRAICASVSSEGGHEPVGIAYSYARKTSKTTLALGVRTPVLSLRPKLLFNSVRNGSKIVLVNVSVLSATSDNLLIEVVEDGVLTGSSFVSVDADSHAEIDESATAITGGRTLYVDYSSTQTRVINSSSFSDLKSLPLTINADNSQNVVTICVTRISAAADIFAGFNWREVV